MRVQFPDGGLRFLLLIKPHTHTQHIISTEANHEVMITMTPEHSYRRIQPPLVEETSQSCKPRIDNQISKRGGRLVKSHHLIGITTTDPHTN
jgi:hypothetical protein